MPERDYQAFMKTEVEKIIDVSQLRPGARVLDLGYGSGIHSRTFSEHGCRVVGIDIDARTKSNDFLAVKADWEKIPLSKKSFDLVTLLYSGVSWEKDLPLLHEIKRVLNTGGKFVFTTLGSDKIIQTYQDEGEKMNESVYVLDRDEKIANGIIYRISTLDMNFLEEEIHERQIFPPDVDEKFIYTRQLFTFEQLRNLLTQFNMNIEKEWHLQQLPETLITPHDSIFVMALKKD